MGLPRVALRRRRLVDANSRVAHLRLELETLAHVAQRVTSSHVFVERAVSGEQSVLGRRNGERVHCGWNITDAESLKTVLITGGGSGIGRGELSNAQLESRSS